MQFMHRWLTFQGIRFVYKVIVHLFRLKNDIHSIVEYFIVPTLNRIKISKGEKKSYRVIHELHKEYDEGKLNEGRERLIYA